MSKNDAIVTILDAFDEIASLKAENDSLRRILEYKNAEQTDGSRWDGAIYEFGRRAIFEKYGRPYYARSVQVTENEDGTLVPEAFEKWYRRAYDEFPDFMSREDFLQEYRKELNQRYFELRDEAVSNR